VIHAPRRGLVVLALTVPMILAGPVVLAGCGGTAPPSSGAGGTGCVVARTITVRGSDVTPPPSTVDVTAGCVVRLTVTADRSSQVHVHVVDLEKPITAGTPVTVELTPTQQGVYEVELHDPDLLLVKLAVR
jgi:hypothetical protein